VALRPGRPSAIGELLTASHESLRVDYQVSGPQLDLAVATALRAGALGARMTGGGFGGSVIALAAGQALQRVVDEMLAAFARAGLPAPSCAPVAPAAGAGRA
jgi:galactokinase